MLDGMSTTLDADSARWLEELRCDAGPRHPGGGM